jgi:hypothetical protein
MRRAERARGPRAAHGSARSSGLAFGDLLAAAGGAVLLVGMFLPWFGTRLSGRLPEIGSLGSPIEPVDAWQAFGVIDVVLFAVAALALGHAAYRATGALPASRVRTRVVLGPLGLVAVAAVLVGLSDSPIHEVSNQLVVVEPQLGVGGFVALAGALAISLGAWMRPAD